MISKFCVGLGWVAMLSSAVLADESPATTETSRPYAGLEARSIKALSPEQEAQYLGGQGMGLALPAELNGYPGPKHVLELADQLGLDSVQRELVQASFDRMSAEAIELGRRYVERERHLDAMFAEGAATAEALGAVLDELGDLSAHLRFTHLHAHLETKRILRAEQISRYQELRGYAVDPAESALHTPSSHHHGH